MTRRDFDEVNDVGTICLNGCTPLPHPAGIELTVAEAYDDMTPLRLVLLTCHGGTVGVEYRLDPDMAEALAHLLLSASKGVRYMAEVLDKKAEQA